MSTDNSSFVQPAIPRFDGHYDHWSMLMENFLRSKEYWCLVEAGISARKEGEELSDGQRRKIEEEKLKDLKVKNYLFQAIDRTIIETILNRDTAKDIWDSMKMKYQGNTKVKRAQLQALRREFELLGMKEGEAVDAYFARTLTIANKMKAHGEKMTQTTIIEKILRSMTFKFNYVVCSIEESNDLSVMTLDELQSSLIVHEQRMQGQKEEEHALSIINSERFGGKYEQRYEGRGSIRGGSSRGRGRGRNRQAFNKAQIQCYNCQKLGHFAYECPDKEKIVNFAEFNEEEEMLLMAYTEPKQSRNEPAWFLDSGCSNHMSGSKEWFFNLDSEFRQVVKLGDNSSMMAMGKGSVKLLIRGLIQTFAEVYFIPELRNNLLSIGQLQEKDLAVLLQHGKAKVFHPTRGLIMESQMSANRMFVISAKVIMPNSNCFKITSSDITSLWHRRYGHLNLKGLRTLSSKNMVTGLPVINDEAEVCKDCMFGKHHRDIIPKTSMWRASKKLQLVHADICGPISPSSHSGKRYVITFIDDYSRKIWAYLLTQKSEALSKFKTYKVLTEKESGETIGCLRTDRGEFTSIEFHDFCNAQGIRRQLTAPHTPQQNGVAERRNRTIMNIVRSMLSEKGLQKEFWPEAVNWAVHVMNRSPTLSVKNVTPEEAWTGIKPCVDHFRVFGSVAFVHVPDCQRKKLDNKSVKCILLGTSEESKAYRLYDPVNKKVVISRDIVCMENEKWDWNNNADGKRRDMLEWEDFNNTQQTADSTSNPCSGDETEAEENQANESATDELGGEKLATDQTITNATDLCMHENTSVSATKGRNRRQPGWLQDYETETNLLDEEEEHSLVLFVSAEDPVTFEEAHKDSKWREAMDVEMKAIEKNKTWELTTLPNGSKPIGVKWVFKTKLNEQGKVEKYKARLVAKGYSQRQGIDYKEVFAPVARWDTIRSILALAAHKNWYVFQLDVKSAFLHGELSEVIFVNQPQGYERQGEEHKVYKLRKALYGLKQAPRAWYSRIESYFLEEGFEKCFCEHTLFIKNGDQGKILIVSLYVDDLIFTRNDENMFQYFKQSMQKEFDMSDLGKMKFFLGIEVIQTTNAIFICQRKYAHEVLERFGMRDCNPVTNPMVPGCKLSKDGNGEANVDTTDYKKLVGSLLYLTATRPDLMFAVGMISRYIENPTELHLQSAKRILRYLRGTLNLGICYKKGGTGSLIAYADSDYAGDVDDRRSTSGYVFMLGTGAVSWSSKKQPVVTLSTTEAEFIAAASCACQGVWMRRILEKLGHEQISSTTIYCDNNSTIKLSRNPVLHGRSKHIDVRFHFLRELTKNGIVEMVHCRTQEQISDIFTKPLKVDTFVGLREKLGICSVTDLNLITTCN